MKDWLARLRASFPAVMMVAVVVGPLSVACGPTEQEIGSDPGGSASSGNAPGSGGDGNGGSASEGGGGGQGGAGTGGLGHGGASCHGDATAWTELTQTPIACTKNSDCCVVINFCLSEAQVVHSSNTTAAKDAWPYCDSDCNDCIPPTIDVFCQDNHCVGVERPDGEPTEHCGIDEMPGTGGTTGEHFGCG